MAKIGRKEALGIGIAVDFRRRNKCNESLQLNVQRLKKYKARLVVFPRKKGEEWTEDMKAATALETADVLPIDNKLVQEKPRAIEAEEREFSAYKAIRLARMNKRQVGPRFVAARVAAEKAANKKKETMAFAISEICTHLFLETSELMCWRILPMRRGRCS